MARSGLPAPQEDALPPALAWKATTTWMALPPSGHRWNCRLAPWWEERFMGGGTLWPGPSPETEQLLPCPNIWPLL